MSSHAITANRLIDGRVVYLTAGGTWSERFGEAGLHAADVVEARLAEIDTAPLGTQVVGAYALAVDAGAATPAPRGQREQIRTRGPSVRPDLGYQAGNG